MKTIYDNQCNFCGEKRDFAKCWRDPAHGAYYAAERKRIALLPKPPEVPAEMPIGQAPEFVLDDGAVQEGLL